MAEESLAAQMVAKLEQQLLEFAGAESITIDGMSVKYSDLERRYDHWKRRLDREQGTSSLISRIRMDNTEI